MHIRKATLQDVYAVQKLVESLAGFYITGDTSNLPHWFQETLAEAEFARRFSSDAYLNLIGVVDGETVGYISMKDKSHLYHLFVAQAEQGKGFGRALWQNALQYCPADRVTLRSSLYAVPVYKRFGFVESGPADERDGIGFQPMEYRRG